MSDVKPCSTCSHRSNNIVILLLAPHLIGCNRPTNKIDVLTGKPEELFCNVERSFSVGCGYNGRYHSDNEEVK